MRISDWSSDVCSSDLATLADLAADLLDRLVAIGLHGPFALAAGDMAHEVAQQLGTIGRMHHFGVELNGVDLQLVIGNRRKGRAVTDADRADAIGDLRDLVAMAHPDLVLLALGPAA